MLEYKLVNGNRVCPGIQKVRVGHATRSVVATHDRKYVLNSCMRLLSSLSALPDKEQQRLFEMLHKICQLHGGT